MYYFIINGNVYPIERVSWKLNSGSHKNFRQLVFYYEGKQIYSLKISITDLNIIDKIIATILIKKNIFTKNDIQIELQEIVDDNIT